MLCRPGVALGNCAKREACFWVEYRFSAVFYLPSTRAHNLRKNFGLDFVLKGRGFSR